MSTTNNKDEDQCECGDASGIAFMIIFCIILLFTLGSPDLLDVIIEYIGTLSAANLNSVPTPTP